MARLDIGASMQPQHFLGDAMVENGLGFQRLQRWMPWRSLDKTGVRVSFGSNWAAGPWAGQVAALAGVDLPVAPLRRQIVVTTPLRGIPDDFPFVIDFSRSLYFHRKGQGILTGQSNPDETPGFDQSIDHA